MKEAVAKGGSKDPKAKVKEVSVGDETHHFKRLYSSQPKFQINGGRNMRTQPLGVLDPSFLRIGVGP